MLVLMRKVGERIIINGGKEDKTIVEIVEVLPGGRVRLGIEAPRSVSVHREEVQSVIDQDRLAGQLPLSRGSHAKDSATEASNDEPSTPDPDYQV